MKWLYENWSKSTINMRNLIVLQVVFCIFVASCTQPAKTAKEEDTGIKEIDIISNISNNQKINLSAVASNIEYCLLETDKKCLVVPHMVVYCSKEYIVTLGQQTDNHFVCFIFERATGKFVRQISRMGQGPNDFQFVYNEFWDEINEQICVACNNQFAFYNLDGTLSHKTSSLQFGGFYFIAHNDFYIKYVPNRYGNSTIRIAFFDKTGALVDSIPNYKSWKKISRRIVTNSADAQFHIFGNNLYYKDNFCDTMYQIEEFTLQPKYIFNTGSRYVPYELQDGGGFDFTQSSSGISIIDHYKKYFVFDKFFEDNQHLYFTFDYNQMKYRAMYDKTKDMLQIMPPISTAPSERIHRFRILYGFENDLDGGLPFWPKQMISEKEMMCVYTAEE